MAWILLISAGILETGFAVALGMALQNVPEGFAVAAALA